MTYKILTETKMYLYCIFVQCLLYNLYCAPSHKSGPVLLQNNVPVCLHENFPVPLHKNVPAIFFLPVILLYNSAKLQYFLQYLAVEFQYCRIRVERWSITVRMGIV